MKKDMRSHSDFCSLYVGRERPHPHESLGIRCEPGTAQRSAQGRRVDECQANGVNVERVGTDDTESFRDKKVPAITIHSITQETLPVLHSPRDNLAAINVDYLYDSYRVVGVYLAYIDQTLD